MIFLDNELSLYMKRIYLYLGILGIGIAIAFLLLIIKNYFETGYSKISFTHVLAFVGTLISGINFIRMSRLLKEKQSSKAIES